MNLTFPSLLRILMLRSVRRRYRVVPLSFLLASMAALVESLPRKSLTTRFPKYCQGNAIHLENPNQS